MDVNSELREAQIEIRDTDNAHSANRKGLIWFNRAADKLKMLFNSEVKTVATEDYVDDKILNDITSSENGLETNGLLTIEQGTTPANPDAGKRKVYAKADGVYELDNAGSEERLARQSDVDSAISGSINTVIFRSLSTQSFSLRGNASNLYTASQRCLVFVKWAQGYGAELKVKLSNNAELHPGSVVVANAGDRIRHNGGSDQTGTLYILNF